MKNHYDLPCNMAQTLNIIGDKWTLLILHEMLMQPRTYKELLETLEGIPSNLLSGRLKSLEADGLILSKLYQSHPPRYHYQLTESGKDLGDVFNSLILWGQKNLQKCYRKLVHTSCKHPIELQYYCPQCNTAVDKGALTVKAPSK